MAIYEKINDLFINFDAYINMAKKDPIAFNKTIEVDYYKQKKRAKKSEKNRAVKDIIDKFILTYGIDGAIKSLQLLKEAIIPSPPNNNLLEAVIEELIDEIEKIYRTAIKIKLIKLLELAAKKDKEREIIQLINKEDDIEFLLGLDETNENVEQITYFPVEEKSSPTNDIALMMNRRIKIRNFIDNYVLLTLGWSEFKEQVFALIGLVSIYQEQNLISMNFLPNLMVICNELSELEQALTEGQSIRRKHKIIC
ncbi:MAG: hypothetical protein K2M17_01655 [Bacilli bacterium]|nr:hypothetical protein [Bacilli bacterium]